MPRPLSSLHRRAVALALLLLLALFGCQDEVVRSSGVVGHPGPGADNAICPTYDGNSSTLPTPLPASPTVSAGTAPGSFAVSASGQATYTVPIAVPPGRLGMEPRLAIAYDSSRGEGTLGVGFALQGLSAITRCPSNMAQDGQIRAVRYDDKDKFCLDGLRLVPATDTDGTGGAGTHEWRTFPDTMRRVISHNGSDPMHGPQHWTVNEKGGHVLEYGGTVDSRAMATGGTVASWHLSTESDRRGNAVDYVYQNDLDPTNGHSPEILLAHIDYTRHASAAATQQVVIDYEDRPVSTLYDGGLRFTRSKLVKRIRTLSSGVLVRSYELAYDENPHTARRRLANVRECAGDGACKPPTSFTWSTTAANLNSRMVTPPMTPGGQNADAWRWLLADVNGDGLDDIVIAVPAGEGADDWLVALNNGHGFDAATLWLRLQNPQSQTADAEEYWSLTPMDYDQDGNADIFIDTPNPTAASWPHYRVLRSDPAHKRFVLIDTPVVHPDGIEFYPGKNGTDADGLKREHYRFVRLGDLNGDGIADLIECLNPTADYANPLAIIPGNPVWNVHLWVPALPNGGGAGWDPTATPITPMNDGLVDCASGLVWTTVVDLDGDGVSEIVVPFSGGTLGGLRWNGAAWNTIRTNLLTTPAARKVHFLDLNGDGLSDALFTGLGVSCGSPSCFPISRGADFGATQPEDVPYHALNDGRTFSALNPTLSKSLLPYTTICLGEPPLCGTINQYEWTDWWGDYIVPLDFNGDGRMDFAMPVDPSADDVTPPSWYIFQSPPTIKGDFTSGNLISGAGDMTAIPTGIPTRVSDVDGTPMPWFLPQVADVLGRGRHDLVAPNPDNDGTFVVFLNGDAQDELLTITDGMNALDPGDRGFLPTVTLHYESLVDYGITYGLQGDADLERVLYRKQSDPTNGCAFPRMCVAGGGRVVDAYTLNDGQNQPRNFDVRYRDARYHRLGRGMLGFEKRIVVDGDTGAGRAEFYDNKTWDETLQVFPFAGQMVESWSWGPAVAQPPKDAGTPTQVELAYTYTTLTEKHWVPGTYFTIPTTVEQVRREGTFQAAQGQTLYDFVRDAQTTGTLLGDTTSIVDTLDHVSGEVLTQHSFTLGVDLQERVARTIHNDVAHWLLGEVTHEEACSTALGEEQCHTTSRTFDGYGEVTGVDVGDPTNPETQLTVGYYRDAFGNVTLTTAYDQAGHYRSSCTSYEPEGIFPFATVNQLGHVSLFEFDRGLGVPTGTVDPNGLPTLLRHDGFGRKTEERFPDGSSVRYSFTRHKNGGPNGDWWNVKAYTEEAGGAATSRELDSLGRTVRALAKVAATKSCTPSGCEAGLTLEQDTHYDHLGRVNRATVPWRQGDPLAEKLADTWVYDAIGRPTEHTEPWGRKTIYTYQGNVVTASDWLGPTSREVDGLGRTVLVTDKNLGTVEPIYGPFSLPYAVTRFGNETTTTKRDAYGRVVEEDDPDRGTTITHYDGFGEVTTVTDGMSRNFAFTYDGLGRLVGRQDNDKSGPYTTTWAYDTAPHGIGKIAKVTSPAGHVDTYTYTPLGQVYSHTLTLADTGESFASTLGYDSLGRLSQVTYPSPALSVAVSVRRDLDAFGNVVTLRDDVTNAPYWQLEALDGAGRPTKEKLGNGVTVTRQYAPDSGALQHIRALGQTSQVGPVPHVPVEIQSLDYTYDLGLRMTSRSDNLQKGLIGPLGESFGYDPIDRLTCVRAGSALVNACHSPILYEPNGNIHEKDGLTYDYEMLRPHVLRSVGADGYSHDGVGNQTDRPDGTSIAYTPFDLPASYSGLSDGTSTSFEYDGAQHRIRKIRVDTDGVATSDTAYLDELYERVRTATGDLQRFYIGAGSAMVVRTRSANGSDTTAYALTEALGSTDVIVDENGGVIERRSYDAFGARRDPNGWGPWQGGLASKVTPVGFEGLEEDDEAGLVNMRGRVYDPKLGRFLSTDPLVSRPGFAQSWNPYAYVLNSPLNFTDPSGFDAITSGDGWIAKDNPTGLGLEVTRLPKAGPPPPPPAAPEAPAVAPAPPATPDATPTKDAGRDDAPANLGLSAHALTYVSPKMQEYLESQKGRPPPADPGNLTEWERLRVEIAVIGCQIEPCWHLGPPINERERYLDERLAEVEHSLRQAGVVLPMGMPKAAAQLGGAVVAPIVEKEVAQVAKAAVVADVFAEHRQITAELGLGPNSTLAKLEVGSRTFWGVNAHGQPLALKVNAISATHAEADAFNQAMKAGIRGGNARLVVNRDLCPACGTNGAVRSMARQLGLEAVEVVTPQGVSVLKP